jgi:hypothetical protein
MQDILYVAGTIGFFALMVAFVAGCDRIIGSDDASSSPGGVHDHVPPTDSSVEVVR